MVYSGYYFVLTLAFIGAGVYKVTSVGWRESFKICWLNPGTLNEDSACQVLGEPNIQVKNQKCLLEATNEMS